MCQQVEQQIAMMFKKKARVVLSGERVPGESVYILQWQWLTVPEVLNVNLSSKEYTGNIMFSAYAKEQTFRSVAGVTQLSNTTK